MLNLKDDKKGKENKQVSRGLYIDSHHRDRANPTRMSQR